MACQVVAAFRHPPAEFAAAGAPLLQRSRRNDPAASPRVIVAALKSSSSSSHEAHSEAANKHSITPQMMEKFKSLGSWVEANMLVHLKPVDKCWQPQDLLPDPSSEGFYDDTRELRERAREVPDDCLVCLVGNMITEEALPTYQTLINITDGVKDETGSSLVPWARWTRSWTAEENRHGDLLNKYLYLTGRANMRQIEKTIQYLISAGMDPKTENNPFHGLIYTTFQERATFVSHGNTARLAKAHGDHKLAQICRLIAADEKRHETAYCNALEKMFEVDADATVLAFADMMRRKIVMPAYLMYDGRDENLFGHFSAVAQRLGIYTAKDYIDIVEFLVERWRVAELRGLSGEGNRAQDFVCGLGRRMRKLEERAQEKAKEAPAVRFSWIYDREVKL